MPELTIKEIKKVVDEGFDKQAVLINSAFQDQKDHFDKQINGLDNKIDSVEDELKTDIQRIETKIDRALHVEYVNLEVRVKRIENKIGLKPINNPTSKTA